ncbi:MAG TPA: NTP transferase domain-containing protein [Candidatus Limnocylindrales bacterium]|nr:NTP transferase domain-containing protein [Candidatus Limnocylindrales bacterium]
MTVAAIVLAAGAATRFGSPKALAMLDGRPLLEHVLDAIRTAGIEEVVVVLGHAADEIEERVDWLSERRVRNPDPRHLSSSLQVGLAAVLELERPVRAVVIALGDQPRTRPEVIHALMTASREAEEPIVIPRYADGGGANPVLVKREAFEVIDEATGDRGLGPLLAGDPDLVHEVPVAGSNPDVDTPADLLELIWAERVRANREQVDRLREVPDGRDFYAPVSALFRANPSRDDDEVLAALLAIARPGETWLDIGAGAGRFALPLARVVGEVVAIDPSEGMLAELRAAMTEHGIDNIRPIEGRWPMPPGEAPAGDVALIAHVGYDIEAIGPFLAAMEAAASRLCVAVLMERQPASAADGFWPIVHGEHRVPLPALAEFVELLRARGASPAVARVPREPRRFASRDEAGGFIRRQLWIADGGEKERRFLDALEQEVVEAEDGTFALTGQGPASVGIVTWEPPRAG